MDEKTALSPEALAARFAEAGATLLALPAAGPSPRLRLSRWPIPPEALQVYAGAVRCRPPVPSPERISRMEETFAWLALIPAERRLLRRLVALRALVHPVSERPLYSWRRLGTLFGADHKAVQRWHAEALALIGAALARGAEREASADPVPPPPRRAPARPTARSGGEG